MSNPTSNTEGSVDPLTSRLRRQWLQQNIGRNNNNNSFHN